MNKKLLLTGMILCGALCASFFSACGECAHEFGEWKTTKSATCSETGVRERTCTKCNKAERDVLPLSDHDWDEGKITTAPTCETEGERTYYCKFDPTHTKTEPIDPLDHDFDKNFTIDRQPTATQEGEKSRHCLREGCNARTDEQAIPIPGEEEPSNPSNPSGGSSGGSQGGSSGGSSGGSQGGSSQGGSSGESKPSEPQGDTIHYRIKVNGRDGSYLGDVGIKIIDKDGKAVFEGVIPKVPAMAGNYAMRDISLPKGEYKVELTTLPAGVLGGGPYTVSEKDGTEPYDTPSKYPLLDIRLKTEVYEGELKSLTKGSIVSNFTIDSVNLGKTTVKELLAKKPVLMLLFYYNGCGPCRNEAPEVLKFYEREKNNVTVVCLNVMDGASAILSGNESYFHYPADEFYFVDDWRGNFLTLTNSNYVPTAVFIDREGIVFENFTGGSTSEYLCSLVESHIIADTSTVNVREYAIMPRKFV